MLSHNLKLHSNRAKSPNMAESKVWMCGLLAVILLLAFTPIVMLSLVTLQPEMMQIPSMFSQVNSHLKQSGIAMENEKCTEHELFNSWHALAHMEEKLLQNVNSTSSRDHHHMYEEDHHHDHYPGLLSVDAVGQAILTTSVDDFQGNLQRDNQTHHKDAKQEGDSTQPPSTSLGEIPVALPSAATPHDQITQEPGTSASSPEISQIVAAQHIKHTSHPTLRWTPHVKRQSGSFMKKRSEAPHKIAPKDIHGAHWVGRIPKVACVMAVPDSTRAHVRLKYAVNNFHSQHYEGPKQLIIVYHYQDHKGADRIRKLADGYLVKAIAARSMEVPSSTALRYGAWSADHDADIVARWDVDGWHHPQRLAMQVRALSFSGQQACLLHRWTVTPGDGSRSVVSGEIGGEHSLVGERAWMDKNWQPFLPEGDQALWAHRGQVALLDMPELLVVSPEHKEEAYGNSSAHDMVKP